MHFPQISLILYYNFVHGDNYAFVKRSSKIKIKIEKYSVEIGRICNECLYLYVATQDFAFKIQMNKKYILPADAEPENRVTQILVYATN